MSRTFRRSPTRKEKSEQPRERRTAYKRRKYNFSQEEDQ